MWWFGWSPRDVDNLTLDETARWLEQANRQIKAQYSKAAI
ncbi:GpE family phage tail protein [Lonepinella koalarum]|nr:GpE family phage tail protein [Lonepinella koalarum]TYG34159.1 GpE family phage tail protein [Lonepinella koalarum]